jgi:hypothetical protein
MNAMEDAGQLAVTPAEITGGGRLCLDSDLSHAVPSLFRVFLLWVGLNPLLPTGLDVGTLGCSRPVTPLPQGNHVRLGPDFAIRPGPQGVPGASLLSLHTTSTTIPYVRAPGG